MAKMRDIATRAVLPACLAVLPCVASCRRPAPRSPAVQVLVIDSFVLDEHGRTVCDIAEQWSLGTCTVDAYDVDVRGPDSYLNALREVADRVSGHPETRFLVNVSLASHTPRDEERQLLERLADRGAVVVAAAGNHDMDQKLYPAAYAGVVAVAASRRGRKQPYSNYGPHVNLAVDTRDIRRTEEVLQLPGGMGLREIVKSGTSLSAPKLAGLLGLLWSGEPNLTRQQVLAAMKSCCRPMRDAYYRRGLLGAGELDDLRMVWLTRVGRRQLVFLAAVILALAAGFVALWWRAAPGAFFAVVACSATLMFYAVLDLPWTLKWGALVPLGVFPAIFGLCRWVAPLRGLRVRVWAGEGCGLLGAKLRRRLRKLGATLAPAGNAGDDPGALPEEQLELLVDLTRLRERGVLCRCRWVGPAEGLPPPPETRELPARGCLCRAAAFVEEVAFRPPRVHEMTDEDLLTGPE